jgi:uncharacterized protein (TIGR00725 family)
MEVELKTLIAVVGSAQADAAAKRAAYEVGRAVIQAGHSLICGGLSGVMEAACKGAFEEVGENSGRIIGILPGTAKSDANQYVDIVLPTGIGYARNAVIACAADALIAVSGGSGTLSEMSYAWQYRKPIVVIRGLFGISSSLVDKKLDERRPDAVFGAETAEEAVSVITDILNHSRGTL